MLDILSVTTPIYLAIATGFLTARFGLFSKSEMRVLGRFVIHIALPALLFNALIQRRFDDLDYLFDIGDLDLNSDFCHFPYQFRAGRREVAIDPQNVRSATQALGVTPRIQKNIPEGPGLIGWGKGHPPNGQPGNGQSIEYEGAEPLPLCVLDLDRVLH